MSRTRFASLFLFSLAISSRYGIAFDQRSCGELREAKPPELLEYLQRDRSTLKPGCIAYAADQIGADRYSPAVKTLITYLDYRMPDDPAKARSPVIFRIPSLGTIYPATDALFEIGMPAVPDLVETVAAAATSDTARGNAIDVLFSIHRRDVSEAVRVLMRASKKATEDRLISFRLYDAARKIADMCKGPTRNVCMNALQ